MSRLTPHDWNEHYISRQTPWDSGVPSKELIRVLDTEKITPCRAGELGCGTGTNSIYLATRGFDTTGFDCSPAALEERERKLLNRVPRPSLSKRICADSISKSSRSISFSIAAVITRCVPATSPGFSERSAGSRGRGRGTWC